MSLSDEFIALCTEEQLKKFTQKTSNGKVAINSYALFSFFTEKIHNTYDILDVLDAFAKVAVASSKLNFKTSPHTGSINNCNGRWFELIFFKEFNELVESYNNKHPNKCEICKLPSATGKTKFYKLFIKEQQDELKKINPSTSNPDFLILKDLDDNIFPTELNFIEKFQCLDYFGKIDMKNVDTILSIKTSARPDRRYQQVYEANLIKALFLKFDKSVNFFTISLNDNKKNEEVYYSPSIISIIKDETNFSSSIDKVLNLEKIEDVKKVFDNIFTDSS